MIAPIYIIVGATGVGKSESAIRIAEKLNAWIISADSRQVYRGMDIGTAKPSELDRAKIRHFLIDVVTPDCKFSVGDFLDAAWDIIKKASEQGKNVLVAGGTGLYVRALVKGFDLAGTPGIASIHDELTKKLETEGLEKLVEELIALDSDVSRTMDLKNSRRVIRALEIIKTTGKSLNESRGRSETGEYRFVTVGLRCPREFLHQRIRLRTYSMMQAGWLEEVRNFQARNYPPDSPALSGIGYKELGEFLNGEIALELAIERIITRTRQYAKRQMTWFNAEDYINWIDIEPGDETSEIDERILNVFHEYSIR